MAIEFFDGNELVNNLATGWEPPWTTASLWFGATAGVGPPTGTYYSGQAASAGYHMARMFLADKATRIIGMHCYFNGNGSAAPMVNWAFGDGFLLNQTAGSSALTQVGIGRNATGHFVAYNGRGPGLTSGGTLLGTSASAPPLNTWVWIEIKVTVHASAGVVHIKLNGVDYLNLTGQDTQNTANATQNSVAITGTEGWYGWDDFVCLNTDGSAPDNDFLGECEVLPCLPSTGNGTHQDSTPSTGTDRGALVDESVPSTSDYNSIATPGDEDTYNYPTLGSTGTIIALQVCSLLSKTDGGACSARNIMRLSGTDYYGAEKPVSTTVGWRTDYVRQDPNASAAWTEAVINAGEFGTERVT